ncbi:trypsin-like peptidase domain-containing protein [Streptomyces sp. R41]|uniref:Trypsin-like peptidase domain-containing protein n=1 Tax=Streptomyces sp. R41 TaxID=3238632 RepID=A0AB39RR85_9ACTN
MAGRGPRTGGRQATDDTQETRDEALVRICDLAGRPRGTGFVADHHGTVITSHEAVDGLARLVLHAPGDRTCVVTADSVTPLPDADLALVRTEGLGLDPLPVTVRDRIATGTYVRIAAGGWREARVLGTSAVTYTATDRFHLLGDALELAIGTAGTDALRLGGGAAGGPVLDASTGAVLGVLGTALLPQALDRVRAGETPIRHRAAGFAVPLLGVPGPLADVLARNAATVPAYGADLNPAGAVELTATSVGSDGPGAATSPGSGGAPAGPVERADTVREFAAFEDGPAAVLGLVGPPGSGRTTELAALAARRTGGAEPAPTLWLRGADLLTTDASVADAATRALERAGRIVAASRDSGVAAGEGRAAGSVPSDVLPPGRYEGELGDIGPERLARLARDAGRPLLLLLDGPEEMPPALAHRLPEWTAGTAAWLRETGARLVVGCRAEYWEQAGAEFPEEMLHRAEACSDRLIPSCVWLGDLTEGEARRARSRAGIPEDALVAADARHPLTLRLLSEVRAALPDAPAGRLDRDDVFAAYLDLMCLRIAVRLAAANGLRGSAVRRLAAQVSGQVHEAARCCLGPGQGELDRASFEAVFPWGPAPRRRLSGTNGWASAVLTEGLLVPAGNGYRFAHEELADWIQGTHLDLDAALHALVHRGRGAAPGQRRARGAPAWPRGAAGPSSTGAAGAPSPAAGAVASGTGSSRRRRSRSASTSSPAHTLPVPRHRIGPVVETLLLLARQQGTAELALRLEDLVDAVDDLLPQAPGPLGDPAWWATHLCADVLRRVPDATPYIGVLRLLAERIVRWREQSRGVPGEFGPSFWEAVPLPETERLDLLRRLVVADEARHAADTGGGTGGAGSPRVPEPRKPSEPATSGADALRTEGADPFRMGVADPLRAGTTDQLRMGVADPLRAGTTDQLRMGVADPLRAGTTDQLRMGVADPLRAGTTDQLRMGAAAPLRAGTTDQLRTGAADPLRTGTTDPLRTGVADPLRTGTTDQLRTGAADQLWSEATDPLRTGVKDHLRTEGRATPTPRYLDAVARLLAADPAAVQLHLTRWFDDERPLPATPHATVATAAQALLYAHRRRALDDLAEALVGVAHRRGDELLAVLAEEEPSAVCRAVDRWAHDERPARRVAAVAYGLRAAPFVRTEADRELLRYAALALLARPADCSLHGGALGLLVRDPRTRARYLPQALQRFTSGDPQLPPSALVAALTTHPDPVLAAFRTRLRQPGPDTTHVLRTLADVTTPALARHVATMVREVVELRPEAAAHVAAYVDRRLEYGPTAGAVLFPLVSGLVEGCPAPVRAALAAVLAAPGTRASRPLRRELLDLLLAHERDPAVLDTLLKAAADGAVRRGEEPTRELVHRAGLLLVRTPAGATGFDRGLVELARHVPGFADLVARWLTAAPEEWASVVGPSTRRMIENLAGVRVPA